MVLGIIAHSNHHVPNSSSFTGKLSCQTGPNPTYSCFAKTYLSKSKSLCTETQLLHKLQQGDQFALRGHQGGQLETDQGAWGPVFLLQVITSEQNGRGSKSAGLPTLFLISCVALNKSLECSDTQFSHLQSRYHKSCCQHEIHVITE